MKPGKARNWERHARALDMWLEGKYLREIGEELGVSKERARQMIVLARQQLAFRVFRGARRPDTRPAWQRNVQP